MNTNFRRGLLRTPYRMRGRDIEGIDCLGVVWLIQNHERKAQLPDPWTVIGDAWLEGKTFDATNGLPPDWKRAEAPIEDGDILLFEGEHVWCATVHEGHVWSAHPNVGVWCKPLNKFSKTPKEVWRRC